MIMETVRRTTHTDCGHGCVIRRAGEVRASAPIRALVAVFVALLAVHFMPDAAYADSVNAEIISGPSVVPFADLYGASIAAPDRYTAAALLMGYGPDAISGWDDDVKAKLSNEGTGGHFYTFADQAVINYFDVTEHMGIFQEFMNYTGGPFWNMAQALYGNNIWAALYTSDELAAAKADLERVLSGEDIGGGGSGDTSIPDSLTFTMGDYVGTSRYMYWGYPSDSYYGPLNVTVTVDMQYVVNDFRSHSDALPYHYYILWRNENLYPQRPMTLDVYFSDNPLSVTNGTGISVNAGTRVAHKTYDGSSVSVNGANNISLSYRSSAVTVATYSSVQQFMHFNRPAFLIDNQSSGTPVVPPTQWPDEPTAPTPPELPEPGTNPTVTPTPWAPVISPTFDFDLNITTEPTSNDLIDWVKKIYFELRSFHTDAQDWFDEVGKGIDGVVKAVDDAQKQIYSELQTIDDTLRDEGQKIRDYMYQMFHWLKDQLNFQNDTFNDNNIVYWLKRIWSKLGNGDVNVRPTDPTTDPTGVWDWLIKLIQNFLIGLASSANDLISEMADLVSQVMHQFPFSIPWDIAAFLSAFAAAPITPDVDVTIPAIEGWWGETVISIDLSPYDTAAAAVRAMEKILFAAFLAWKSKDLLEFMDVTKWFNG